MTRRYVSLWFRYLVTDWFTRRDPALGKLPFVLTAPDRGRITVTAANRCAEQAGIFIGMALPDARVLVPTIENFDDKPDFALRLLDALAGWAIRYTPIVQISGHDGLLLDITGCAHLRGGEFSYLKDIIVRLRTAGYDVRGAMADTAGAAWAVSRYGSEQPIIAGGAQAAALAKLPPSCLRISDDTEERLRNLGMRTIQDLVKIPRSSLNRRFGPELTMRLCQALGEASEVLTPKRPVNPYEETLVSSDGVSTAEGIAHALKILLARLCERLKQEGKGARALILEGHRLDGAIEQVAVGTSRPSRSETHLFKPFEDKLTKIEPELGIETFILSCPHVEDVTAEQDEILGHARADDAAFPEMIDRLTNKLGARAMTRYLPQERHWPERSVAPATSMQQKPAAPWEAGRIRPIRLLTPPEPVEVTAPVPDYPPMFFLHNGRRHRVRKADGPERIEREWWLDAGDARDYFRVEDEEGGRYWLFRSGPYKDGEPARWYMHGVFA